jgi:hypothetical protein
MGLGTHQDSDPEPEPVSTQFNNVQPPSDEIPGFGNGYRPGERVTQLQEEHDRRRKQKQTGKSVRDVSTPFDVAESPDNAAPLVVRQPLATVIRKQEEDRDERETRSRRPFRTCERCHQNQIFCSLTSLIMGRAEMEGKDVGEARVKARRYVKKLWEDIIGESFGLQFTQ